ncbi:MAG: putative Mn2+ efflux pump MntP [Colwellia sp.]|jgi:putative Mn2+ efflux pump MntP
MIEVLILAVALSMDAFAISIGLGAKHNSRIMHLSLMSAVYFGLFQGVIPLIGYLGGKGVLGWIESFSEGIEEDITQITHRVMLILAIASILAIATSIDAMAAGFSLTILDVNPLIACLIIGSNFCPTILFLFQGSVGL